MLVDACQSVPHMVVDVQGLDADFLVASSHKVSLLPYVQCKSYRDKYTKLRNKHASDVWAYRHWILIWQEQSLVSHASIPRYAIAFIFGVQFLSAVVLCINTLVYFIESWSSLNLILRMVFLLLGGGEMISDVFLDHSTYAEPPSRLAILVSS